MTTSNVSGGIVFLVGAGPGDPGLLTLKAAALLRSADVLLYDYLASAPTVALAPDHCEKIFVGKQAGKHSATQEEINALIVAKAREGKRVVRLKGGDPFVFGRGAEEAQELRAAGIPFEIVPGITSAIAAPAYAGIPVTHRAHNISFTVMTGHEDPTKGASSIDWARFADANQTLVLLMAMGNLEEIARKLIAHGLSASTPAAAITEGTRPTQRTVVATLETIAQAAHREGIGAPAIVVIGDVVNEREEIAWFDRAPLFGKRVLITRPQTQSQEFEAALCERGAQPLVAPTIEIVPVPGELRDRAHAALVELVAYDWIVFTSQNAVEAFFAMLHEHRRDARALGGCKVAAIGPKTAGALQQYGITADCIPVRYIAEAVAQAVLEQTNDGERILLFCAQDARDVLPERLRAAGRSVDVVAAYRSELRTDPQIAAQTAVADIITFTSASTVDGFMKNLGESALDATRDKMVACIGPITAAAARAHGLHVDVVAQDFTVDGLVSALEDVALSSVSASLR